MQRLRHVHGTKQRPRGRQCIRVTSLDGAVIVDGIHTKHWNELAARLSGHYGNGAFRMRERDMHPGEQYAALDLPQEAA